MNKKINKYFNAELNDQAEKEMERELLSSDSAERDMLYAFAGFKGKVSYPLPEKKTKISRFRYAIAASLVFLVASLLSISLLTNTEKSITSEKWEVMTVFEKVGYLVELDYEKTDQSLIWEFYQSEQNINVKMAMLRILDTTELAPGELDTVIEEEVSPIIKNTLLAMR